MSKSIPVFQNPASDGGSFYWKGDPENRTAILLFHGFTATTVEVRSIAQFFHEKGFHVSGPLLPGHGVSPEELNRVNYHDWIDSAETEYQKLADRFEKVYLIGESMGGLLALWLATAHLEINGLMVFAPALKIPNLWISEWVWPLIKVKPKQNVDLSSSWQGFNVVPMRAAAQLLRLQRTLKRRLSNIQQPALIFQGKLDATIDPTGALEVLQRISSTEKGLIWLEESTHCILLDKQIDVVQEICLDFVK